MVLNNQRSFVPLLLHAFPDANVYVSVVVTMSSSAIKTFQNNVLFLFRIFVWKGCISEDKYVFTEKYVYITQLDNAFKKW